MNLENIFYTNSCKNVDIQEEKMSNSLKIFEKMEEYIVDRIEDKYAVCENRKTGKIENIKLSDLPQEIKEGSYIIFKENKYYVSEDKEKEIKQRIEEKMNKLWK